MNRSMPLFLGVARGSKTCREPVCSRYGAKLRLTCIGFMTLLISGCASYGVVENTPKKAPGIGEGYSFLSWKDRGGHAGEIALILAFSGGGTRAAALSYGVMEELRDTEVVIDGQPKRLLDEVDRISSVSGGSFTAAYYGLHGDKIFEDAFLRRDGEGALFRGLFNPLRWFSSKGRTEMAVEYNTSKPGSKNLRIH